MNDYQRKFAASVGGPILKNNLFFFFSYEGLRDNSTNYETAFVETPQFRQAVTLAAANQHTGQVFQNPGRSPCNQLSEVPCPAGFGPENASR